MQADVAPTVSPAYRTPSPLEGVTEATRVLTEVLFDLPPVLDTVVRRRQNRLLKGFSPQETDADFAIMRRLIQNLSE